jgi:Tfp pilus assembly protein PilF
MTTQIEPAARLQRLRAMLESDPGNYALLTDCADLAMGLGQVADAQAWAERAVAAAPGDPAMRYNLGYTLLHGARYAEAKEALSAIAEHPAAPPGTRNLLARALHYLGEVKEAIELLRKQLEVYPDDAAAAGMLSLLYLDADDFAEARRWSRLALGKQPANLDALLAAGTVALGDEREDEAREVFESAVKLSPANGRAWAGLGVADMMKFDLGAACRNFEKAAAHMPDYIGTWHALAWCQMLEKDYAGARASLERAMAIDRNAPEVHGGLAMLATLQGREEEANQHAKRALALDPGSFGGRMVKVLKMQRAGKGELARQMVERGMKSRQVPGGGSLADMMKRMMLKRQNRKDR